MTPSFDIPIRYRTAFLYGAVFLSYLLAARMSSWVFLTYETAPAVIWPATGIAIAVVYIWGYRMAVPIGLAHFANFILNPIHPPLLVMALSTIGYTIQPIIGAWALKYFGFQGTVGRTRDALTLVGLSLVIPGIGPAFGSAAQFLAGTLTASITGTFARAWAGGVLSALVVLPLLTSWFAGKPLIAPTPAQRREALAALMSIVLMTYITFWTPAPQWNSFVIIYLLLSVLFWIGLRTNARTMITSMFLVSALGILGSIVAQPTDTPLNRQLLADELFVVLIAPIFYILATLVEERRTIALALATRAAELEEALAKLAQDDLHKNEFIAILAHELRNPLAPIVSALQLLRLRNDNPRSRDLIELAERQTSTMRRLLDDLLDVARITQKDFKLAKEPTELSAIISRCVESAEGFLRSRSHTFAVNVPPEKIWLNVDAVRFEQIVVNLLNNAAKYTEKGGHISLKCLAEKEIVSISIQDTGIGLEKDVLGKIFTPFSHAPNMPRVGTGLGIGLSLTKRLVEMHDGTISVESDGAGKGSTFTVRFPLSILENSPLQVISAKIPEVVVQSLRILVVDDNRAAAEGLSKLLSHRGHTVHTTSMGNEVARDTEAFRPDVIFLDIGLPDIDGYEVARRLRKQAVRSTIIALTGYGQEKDKRDAQRVGIDYHLTKPVGLAEIESVLRQFHPPVQEKAPIV